MVAPFAPHLAEELWQRLGHKDSLAYEPFPVADPALLAAQSVTYPVQVNGKVRGRIEIAPSASEDEVRAAALAEVATALEGREPRKVIVVPGRVVSVVVVRPTRGLQAPGRPRGGPEPDYDSDL
jgi:leucyl-tRNA synthetase